MTVMVKNLALLICPEDLLFILSQPSNQVGGRLVLWILFDKQGPFFLANYPIRHFLTNAPTFPVLIPLSVVQLYLCKGELCSRHTMGKGKL